jgi:hypothetical protein
MNDHIADAGKVMPSDEELLGMWGWIENRDHVVEFARAVLARYGATPVKDNAKCLISGAGLSKGNVESLTMSVGHVQKTAESEHEPVAWMTPGGDVSRSYLWCVERCLPDVQLTPLYAAPPAQPDSADDVRDAARYRYLRSLPYDCSANEIEAVIWIGDEDGAPIEPEGLRFEQLDAAIDAAMQRESGGG